METVCKCFAINTLLPHLPRLPHSFFLSRFLRFSSLHVFVLQGNRGKAPGSPLYPSKDVGLVRVNKYKEFHLLGPSAEPTAITVHRHKPVWTLIVDCDRRHLRTWAKKAKLTPYTPRPLPVRRPSWNRGGGAEAFPPNPRSAKTCDEEIEKSKKEGGLRLASLYWAVSGVCLERRVYEFLSFPTRPISLLMR